MMFRSYTAIAAAGILLGSTGLAAAALARVETDLNVRSGPGTEYRVVGVLPGGAPVDVGACNGGWCRVNYQGISGFASASYLDVARGGPAVAVAPTYGYDYYDDYGYGPGFWDYGYYGPSFGIAIGGGRHFRHRRHWSGGRGHHWNGDHHWSGGNGHNWNGGSHGRGQASWHGRGHGNASMGRSASMGRGARMGRGGGRGASIGGGGAAAHSGGMSAGGRGGASVGATVGRGGGGGGHGGGGHGGRR